MIKGKDIIEKQTWIMEIHCYIISYDLCKPERDYTSLFQAIKAYQYWGRLTESTWAVVSPYNSVEIRDDLLRYIDDNDRLIVIQSGKSAAWTKVMASNDWVKEALVK